jgi:tRNA dimethylallyltransferase
MINYSEHIIVIAGPTASGKSSLAIQLAKDINGYIINADSRQIYKELRIGTAQPIPDIIEEDIWYIDGIKHFNYGIISARENYSIYQYQKDVQNILDNNTGIPILVGGTGLYIDSIVFNYNLKPNNDNQHSREELNCMNVNQLQNLLDKDILDSMNNSDINNPIRLIRAIERGSTYDKGEALNHTYVVIERDEEDLHKRMELRIEQMFEEGLEKENRDLLDKGFTYDMQAMRSIGYREFERYFKEEIGIDQVKEDILTHTKQYAKRQKTWFKRNNSTKFVKPELAYLKAQLPF